MNVIFIGAHPDDCETKCGGTAALMVAAGHRVKFVSVTDGAAGHQLHHGPEIAARRLTECAESQRRLDLAGYEVLPFPDGHLEPTLEARAAVIRTIRQWDADLVITHRPCDYHPDHRYTAALVQDSAYLVMVPAVCPDTPALRKNPVYAYMQDDFTRPTPFRPDITVDIASVWNRKIDALDAHASQYYEWLPWVEHTLDTVPHDPAARRAWLDQQFRAHFPLTEAYELSEYGHRPTPAELGALFPR